MAMCLLRAECSVGKYQDETNRPICKDIPLPHSPGTYETVVTDGTSAQIALIKDENGDDYAGATYNYDTSALVSLGVLCASIQDQCDQGLNGEPCLFEGTPSGQRNRTCDESVACGTADDGTSVESGKGCSANATCKSGICGTDGVCARCPAYLACVYAGCTCKCKEGYYGEYCASRKSITDVVMSVDGVPCSLKLALAARCILL